MNGIYAADLSPLQSESVFLRYYAAASENRRKKADAYKKSEDRVRSIGAEALLFAALKTRGIDRPEIAVDGYGKPFLRDGGAFFNLSHSGNFVFCAVSDAPVGCDVEEIKSVDLSLAKRWFTAEEYAAVFGAEDPTEAFFRQWTLKESYLKAIGTGLLLPLDGFTVRTKAGGISVERTEKWGDGCQIPDIAAEKWYFSEYAFSGYRAAVCSAEAGFPAPVFVQL